MLQIQNIKKKYVTGELVQLALDGVSLKLRDSEFVAILGPSGSGKTTLLNVIGGLDRYDAGDLIIGDVQTRAYKDRDWDAYRNHMIGFVFQSYNLIPHQTILANVELALTISGVSRRERRRRAKEALAKVGLSGQEHKKPNQMSGGQMQRVAIARALINNPDILLADEPTGALDSDTSVQVLELLKEVARQRLVIMVTHNAELARTYATRIVNLKDGKIIGDTAPYEPEKENRTGAAKTREEEQKEGTNAVETKKEQVTEDQIISKQTKYNQSENRSTEEARKEPTKRENGEEKSGTKDEKEKPGTKDGHIEIRKSGKGTRKLGRTSMSFLTALSLSFANLRTKKGRTILTSLAGSIGIIGIALILALSTGVNNYIADIQKDTMTSYPITIDAESVDLTGFMNGPGGAGQSTDAEDATKQTDAVYADGDALTQAGDAAASITENNLTAFKQYLDDPDSDIRDYLGENGIIYSYDVAFDVYTRDANGVLVNTDGGTQEGAAADSDRTDGAGGGNDDTDDENSRASGGFGMQASGGSGGMSSVLSGGSGSASDTFSELLPGSGGAYVSDVVKDNYEMTYGEWPADERELVLVMDENNEIPIATLAALGLIPAAEYEALTRQAEEDADFTAPDYSFSYEDILNKTFYLIPACDTYEQEEDGTFSDISGNETKMEALVANAVRLKISGIIQPKEDADNANITGNIGYTTRLTNYLIDHTHESPVTKAQLAAPEVNVLNGMHFTAADDAAKEADAKTYYDELGVSDKAALFASLSGSIYAEDTQALQSLAAMDEVALADAADTYFASADAGIWLSIYDTYVSPGSYEENMTKFGYVSLDAPSSISIYADSFEDKDAISEAIEDYNAGADAEERITYTDYVALLMSSVTTIINVISYVLIAFVAVSLVVSSIMIGIITYISVLERTKEIGILRALGASKRGVSNIFNAETFIVGLAAGLLGIGIASLLLIPGNALIHALTGSAGVNAVLPLISAVILVGISILLTLIGGFIPSRHAAKKDPVSALRTE